MNDYGEMADFLGSLKHLAEKENPENPIVRTDGIGKSEEYTFFCPNCTENITFLCRHIKYSYCPYCGQKIKNFETGDRKK